jgi:hypothetical protein
VFRLVDIFLLDAHTGVPRGNLSVHNIQVIEELRHRVAVVVVVVVVPARDSSWHRPCLRAILALVGLARSTRASLDVVVRIARRSVVQMDLCRRDRLWPVGRSSTGDYLDRGARCLARVTCFQILCDVVLR